MLDTALALAELVSGQILSDEKLIAARLEEACGRLAEIGQKLDQQVLTRARAAVSHLQTAVQAETDQTRREETQIARSHFNELRHLPPEGLTGETPNETLIGLGAWGNFHCALLRGEKRQALREVYSLGVVLPVVAVTVFEPGLFEKDWRVDLREQQQQLAEAKVMLAEVEARISKRGWLDNLLPSTPDPIDDRVRIFRRVNHCERNLRKCPAASHIEKECRSRLATLNNLSASTLTP